MKTISIDIETYSGTDLGKCGVYKYTEDPDFEVLLFGYAVDGGEVHVVDLALGEKIPADIAASLTDENVLKFAFNANFERVCLSQHLGMPTGEYLDPSSWRCTMVWAAYMGLPLSLQGVGTVLNLDKQKLTEGKELIKYFCSPCAPTKSNGGRTRNRPEDAPEKWSLFKSYNLRDVETEMGIQQKLTKFPVPEFVWDEYHIDQEINDRGVRLDIPLVDTAIRMPYDVWERQGFLQTTEGNVVHYGYIEKFIESLGERFNIREIAFDRWGAVQMVQNLEGMGFTVVPFGQGFKDMSPPTKELMKLVLEQRIAHGGHPALRWMMDNIFIRTDPAGNIKPDKEKSTEKIDGAVATIMALDRAIRCGNDTAESVYDSRGLLFI